MPPRNSAQAIAEGALAANFESDKYKTEKKNDKSIDSVLLTGYSDAIAPQEKRVWRAAASLPKLKILRATSINEPSNKLTPKILAEKAEAMAKQAGLAVEILDEKSIADLKMGALLSVAQGGPEPPASWSSPTRPRISSPALLSSASSAKP